LGENSRQPVLFKRLTCNLVQPTFSALTFVAAA
jgi:hypothetical protein